MKNVLANTALLTLFATVIATAGCAEQAVVEATDGTAADITKRVNPDASMAGFELGNPSWDVADFGGVADFTFTGGAVAVGQTLEKVPGDYSLSRRIAIHNAYQSIFSNNGRYDVTIPLTRGFISVYTPAGIRISRAKPVTFGSSVDELEVEQGTRPCGQCDDKYVWMAASQVPRTYVGSKPRAVVLADNYTLRTAFDVERYITLREGDKADIVLPVATYHFAFDPINADFPGTKRCNFSLKGGWVGDHERSTTMADSFSLRQQPELVMPAGARATLSYCGIDTPLTPDADVTIRMNRLEVEDMTVHSPVDGSVHVVHGTFVLERKNNAGSYSEVLTEETHRGVDIPDGTYRLTTRAPNAPTDVREVTFP